MRILMLNYEFPPLGGGASPVSYDIAKGYVKLGHFVSVVTMGFKGLPEFEIDEGINIYRLKCLRRKKEICTPIEMLSYVISARLFLKKHLRKVHYDINHTHFIIPTGLISLWAKKKFGLDYIITSHGSDVPGFNNDRFKLLHNFTRPFLRIICANAKTIVSPSNYLKDLIKKNIKHNLNKKVIKIPNGLNPDKFKPKKKKKIILSTGRLLPRKGFQYLIKAVSDLETDYEVHICGNGPMMQELNELAKISKTKIVFHGWLDNKSKVYRDILGSASIYVLASLKENASISLLEAMSAGCAVITTDVSGCPETVGDSGLLVKPGDVKGLKFILNRLMKNKNLIKEYRKKATEKVIEKYSKDTIIDQYKDLLANNANISLNSI